jgi:hypothetical protein
MSSDASQPDSTSQSLLARLGRMRIGRVPVVGVLSVVAVTALLVGAYSIGNPPSAGTTSIGPDYLYDKDGGTGYTPGSVPMAAATAAPAAQGESVGRTSDGKPIYDQPTSNAASDQTQIVKTGSMALEVTDLDKAVATAQSTIVGYGGYVADSTRYGGKDQSGVATVTYRLPVSKWDDALAAMRGLASKVISEQTNATDVTMQVVDLEARLKNLQSTEAALQGIMARASAIPDVLATQEQLTNVRGQIEQLTAQRDHIKDQASMSTLAVTFSTPTTVTVQATKDWSFGAQVDEAVAALVRIGQGLATIAVWAAIVGVPLLVGLLVLWIVFRISRRIRRRGSSAAASV